MTRRLAMALSCLCACSSAVATEVPRVEPLGAFPFRLQGLSVEPSLLLWCNGPRLLGVVVLKPRRSGALPSAILLRDGRCDPGGEISFGVNVARETMYFEHGWDAPQQVTVRFLYRFEGSVRDDTLDGTITSVDIGHPGHAFQRSLIRVGARREPSLGQYASRDEWRVSLDGVYAIVPPLL